MEPVLSVTVSKVMAWDPCQPDYNRKRVKELFDGRKKVTAVDILNMAIPVNNRLWAVLREDLISADVLHEFACQVAEKILIAEREASREPDPRSWAAIDAKRKWLRGEITDGELTAARTTAASLATVWDAAREATRAAARAAARSAAWAARSAAWAAGVARDARVELLLNLLRREK